ncbi:hypothetical protein MMC09_006820 [Bachmanniomyces sp. S44760]|nr:hypothetical protein [Bachmanniomyces sp. S44760]
MELFRKQLRNFQSIQRRNIRIFRQQPLNEISGAFGDLGTLLPIIIGLSNEYDDGDRHCGGLISLPSTLVLGGFANILTGLFFGIPLPVQPMKAIAAVAIAQRCDWNMAQTVSAGLFVAGVIGILSITGLLEWFTKRVPIPIVKGIQVGTGLSLIASAGTFKNATTFGSHFFDNRTVQIVIFILAIILLLFSQVRRQIPNALIILLICFAIVLPETLSLPANKTFEPWKPYSVIPSPSDFWKGAIDAGIGQVPLTTLNSIVAVSYLAADLLPDAPTPSATALGYSVAGMNLVSLWFGAMPICHGSGGLAAQYRFGARSGASVIFLGVLKLCLGLFASPQTLAFCQRFPKLQLALLVFVAGLELAMVGETLNNEGARDLWEADGADVELQGAKKIRHLSEGERKRRWQIMFVTIGGILAFKNDAVGLIAGLLLHFTYIGTGWLVDRRPERIGRIRLENEPLISESATGREGSERL